MFDFQTLYRLTVGVQGLAADYIIVQGQVLLCGIHVALQDLFLGPVVNVKLICSGPGFTKRLIRSCPKISSPPLQLGFVCAGGVGGLQFDKVIIVLAQAPN